VTERIFAVLYVSIMGLTRCYKTTVFLHLFTIMAEFTAHVKSSSKGHLCSNMALRRLVIDAYGSVKMGFGRWEQKCFYTVSL